MSSAGITVDDGGAALYFCHKCSLTVTITLSPTGDLFCPTCNSDFVEEYEDPDPEPEEFTDIPSQAMFNSLLIDSDSPTGSPVFPHPAIFRQSSFGAEGFNEELIHSLAENDPNRYGTRPASKSAVEGLPSIKADEELMSSELAQCAVCKDDFEMGLLVKQMPCKHVYHEDCILPWLELHNSCPVCRRELPMDHPEYENWQSDNDGEWSDGSSSSGSWVTGRRFTTILLPWPYGSSSSQGGSECRGQQNRESN